MSASPGVTLETGHCTAAACCSTCSIELVPCLRVTHRSYIMRGLATALQMSTHLMPAEMLRVAAAPKQSRAAAAA